MNSGYTIDMGEQNRRRFVQTCAYVSRLRAVILGRAQVLTIHELARVIAPFVKLPIQTGNFIAAQYPARSGGVPYVHSWLLMRRGWIIDLQPVGMVSEGPVAVNCLPGMGPGCGAYRPFCSNSGTFARVTIDRAKIKTVRQQLWEEINRQVYEAGSY